MPPEWTYALDPAQPLDRIGSDVVVENRESHGRWGTCPIGELVANGLLDSKVADCLAATVSLIQARRTAT